ncbi:MAG TPA: aminotransferase class IV [bacterium]|nr:aminotransferase class IV [bacterium]
MKPSPWKPAGKPDSVWVDGRWVPLSHATLGLERWQPWSSLSLAESVAVERGVPLHLGLHLERLATACRAMGWPDPDRRVLSAVARQLPVRNRLRRGGLRLRWWGGRSRPLFLAFGLQAAAPAAGGLRLMTSAVRHYGADSLNGRAKLGQMLPNWLARAEIEAYAEDGLRLTPEGLVAEAVWSNIFALKRGVVRTPPLGSGILDGVARTRFIAKLRRGPWEVREEPLTRYDLWTADRVWLSSSLRGILEVVSVDGRTLGPDDILPGPAGSGKGK